MTGIPRFAQGPVLIICLTLALPAALIAQQDADSREVSAYVLTEAGIAKFRQSQLNLADLEQGRLGICSDTGESAQSIDGMVAQIQAVPGAAAAIESAGMPVREYAVFVFSMIQTGLAAWVLDQPGGSLPPDVSMENVEFYGAHQAELEQAASLVPESDCDEAADNGWEE